ncbi:MAG: PilZ domain-containing protein [Mariprofundus sp.]
MKTHHNLRSFSRSKVSVGAILTVKDKEPCNVKIVDLSMTGMFITSDTPLADGDRCSVSILIGHMNHELPIIATGVVIRTTDTGIALKFQSLRLDSTATLQQMIIENADNPEQAKTEFSRQGFWMFEPEQ